VRPAAATGAGAAAVAPAVAARLRPALLDWYAANRRKLPWRGRRDPYRIWVSEVMLQQTQVSTAVPYYRRFVARFPDVASLARARLDEVLKLWEGLGYYARARNLHRAAAQVAAAHGGRVPRRYEDFRRLPGVGDYIAAAVLSIAFDQPFAVVDGNVKRVLSRLLAVEAPVEAPASRRIFREAAAAFLERSRPGEFNQAMMELGALVCTPRDPSCGRCPLSAGCRARLSGRPSDYPRRSAPRPVPTAAIAVGIVRRNGRVLITRRRPEGLLGGLWEFPGGKIRDGERPEEACRRELREETGLAVDVGARVARIRHAYSHLKIVMEVFWCRAGAGRVRLNGPIDFRWVRIAELARFPFPKANHKFIPLLARAAVRPAG
jgi:A/G-specific adenine glycosylase